MKNLIAFISVLVKWFAFSFVFMKLYNWYIPVQFDVNSITYTVSLGVGVIFSLLSFNVKYENKGKELINDEIRYIFSTKMVVYSSLLLFGWLVSLSL